MPPTMLNDFNSLAHRTCELLRSGLRGLAGSCANLGYTLVTERVSDRCTDAAAMARARRPMSLSTSTGMPTARASAVASGAPSVGRSAAGSTAARRRRPLAASARPPGGARTRAGEVGRRGRGQPREPRTLRTISENDELRRAAPAARARARAARSRTACPLIGTRRPTAITVGARGRGCAGARGPGRSARPNSAGGRPSARPCRRIGRRARANRACRSSVTNRSSVPPLTSCRASVRPPGMRSSSATSPEWA